MGLAQAAALIMSILTQLGELSSSAQSANGERLVAMLNGVRELAERARAVFAMVQGALQQDRKELSEDEMKQIRDLDDQARTMLVNALGTPSTFEKPKSASKKDQDQTGGGGTQRRQ